MNFSTISLTPMISLPNPTQSPTSQSLTDEKRAALIDLLAQRYLDSMSGRDLERFFLDIQTEYLQDYTDTELISEIEDYTTNEEFEELINEA
jgi:hypothetical protein